MKNKNQARHNGGTKPPSPQGKTPVVPGFAPLKTDINQTCLAIYNRATQRPVEKIPLTEEELDLLFTLRGHQEAENLVADAIRDYMAGAEPGGSLGQYSFQMPKAKTTQPLCLCIYDRKYQEPVVLVSITEAEFELLKNDAAATEDCTVASLVVNAIRKLLILLKKNARPASAPAPAQERFSLVLFDNQEGMGVAQIDLLIAEYHAIRANALENHEPLSASLERAAAFMAFDGPVEDLEGAHYQSNSLQELLLSQLESIQQDSVSVTPEFVLGCQKLVAATTSGLTAASENALARMWPLRRQQGGVQ